jgi:hypothetical protein
MEECVLVVVILEFYLPWPFAPIKQRLHPVLPTWGLKLWLWEQTIPKQCHNSVLRGGGA